MHRELGSVLGPWVHREEWKLAVTLGDFTAWVVNGDDKLDKQWRGAAFAKEMWFHGIVIMAH